MLKQVIVLLSLLLLVVSQQPTPSQDDIINVHMIAHTHDDVGWLLTVDEYYTSQVRYILDTVVQQLTVNPDRKFIYVEIAYFFRWWREQDDQTKQLVRQLVQNGQLEFINGGWSMNDEANPYYEDIVDNMAYGHKFLLQEFGITPTIGWHIDPFGHSSSQAAMFSQMGFNAFFWWREDYQDRIIRGQQKRLEFLWSPPQASQNPNNIFTSILYNSYSWPPTFSFDIFSSDPDIVDDPRLETYNVESRANDFVNYFQTMSQQYQHPTELMHTMGMDFNYQSAQKCFKNMDILFKYINDRTDQYKMRVFYSTPSQYIQAINKLNVTYTVNQFDFFPYADVEYGYWSGYYTSRVAGKYLFKYTGRFLQSIRSFFSLLKMSSDNGSQQLAIQDQSYPGRVYEAINNMEETMGIVMHHDAISGTEKQAVAYNYNQYCSKSFDLVNDVYYEFLQHQASQAFGEDLSNFTFCNWNMSAENCPINFENLRNNQTVILSAYNPTVDRQYLFRTKIPYQDVNVYDQNNTQLMSDIFCTNMSDPEDCDLYFIANLQAYSFSYYKLVPDQNFDRIVQKMEKNESQYYLHVHNKKLKVFINGENASDIFINKCNEDETLCDLHMFITSYYYYESYQGDGQKSGAYIFRPSDSTINGAIPYAKFNDVEGFQGQFLTIMAFYSPQITAHLKFYNDAVFINEEITENIVEIETFVNSIDITDGQGKELVLRLYDYGMNNSMYFYTDSNGLELQERLFNHRFTWDLQVNEPVAGSYFPVNAMIMINDTATLKQFYVLNDRSQGGSCYVNGQIELMIHRRLVDDDNRGVGEPLNELNPYNHEGLVQKMRHYVIFADNTTNPNIHRQVQFYNDLDPIQRLALPSTPSAKFNDTINEDLLKVNMQYDVEELLKVFIQVYDEDSYIVRFHNMDEYNSKQVTLRDRYDELTLNANQLKSTWERTRMQWQTEENLTCGTQDFNLEDHQDTLTVKPLEIRTFRVYSNHFGPHPHPHPQNSTNEKLASKFLEKKLSLFSL